MTCISAPRSQNGFSLLEVLVAFSILAMSVGVLMQIFSSGLRNVEISGNYARAVALAETQLISAGANSSLVGGEESGTFGDSFHWHTIIQPMDENIQSSQLPGIQTLSPISLMQISVTVTWRDGMYGPRSVTLHSARVSTKKP